MATYDWQPASASLGDWSDIANWTADASSGGGTQSVTGPPTENDTALFSGGAATTVTGGASFGTIALNGANLTLNGSFAGGSSGGTITDMGLTSTTSILTVASFGTVDAATVDLASSTVDVQGSLVIGAGQISAATVDGLEGYLVSLGNLAISQLQVTNGGTVLGDITLLSGSVLSIDSMSNVSQGTLTTSGSDTIRFTGTAAPGAFTYFYDDIECAAGDALTLDGQAGTLTTQIDGAIDGSGDIKFLDGSFALSGPNTATGSTTVVDSTVVVRAGFGLGSGAVLLNGSKVYATADWEVNQLQLVNGSTASGVVTIADGGAINIDAGSTLALSQINTAGQAAVHFFTGLGVSQPRSLASNLLVGAGGTLDFDSAGASAPLILSGQISGDGELQLSNGTFVVSGSDVSTGGTSIVNAALSVAFPGSLGTGPVALNDSSLTFSIAPSSSPGAAVQTFGGSDTVTAGGQALVVSDQTSSGLTFIGGAATSWVFGGSGVLDATGGSGGDILFGGSSGNDTLRGGMGQNYLITGANGGLAETTGDSQQVFVGTGGSSIFDGSQCAGEQGFFVSNSGTTLVRAGSGINLVVSGNGNSSIVGSSGGLGVFMVGTGQVDINLTSGNHELVEIVGFQSGNDHLDLSGFGPNEASAAVASSIVWEGTTLLQLSDSTTIALFGYSDLSVSDFR